MGRSTVRRNHCLVKRRSTMLVAENWLVIISGWIAFCNQISRCDVTNDAGGRLGKR